MTMQKEEWFLLFIICFSFGFGYLFAMSSVGSVDDEVNKRSKTLEQVLSQ